jgi:hypothetical protein
LRMLKHVAHTLFVNGRTYGSSSILQVLDNIIQFVLLYIGSKNIQCLGP